MTDHDRDLQDAFDQHLRGEGPPPTTDDDPEAAAYEAVYAALSEEPEGDLPENFAEQVADRVGLTPNSDMGWAEIALLLLIIAAAGAGLVWMPPSVAGLQNGLGELVLSLRNLSQAVRIDVILASALVLLVTVGLDAIVNHLHPRRPSASL